jgi:hypothetical protein
MPMTLALPSMLQTSPTTPAHEIHQATAGGTIAYLPIHAPRVASSVPTTAQYALSGYRSSRGFWHEHDDLLLGSGVVGALAALARSIVRLVGLGLDELTDAVARLNG